MYLIVCCENWGTKKRIINQMKKWRRKIESCWNKYFQVFSSPERHWPQALQIRENRPGSSFGVSYSLVSHCVCIRASGLVLYMDWTYLYPLSWWVPQVKCVGVYIFVFQELEGKFRASDDCLQACHSAVQVVRTHKYSSTLLVPTKYQH
jgi:hypothetical protein